MIIYKDLLSIKNDELISDAYEMKEVEKVDGIVEGGLFYELECKMVTIRKGADVDIGANASAEEAPQDFGDSQETETVIDAVHAFRLARAIDVPSNSPSEYMIYLRRYFKQYEDHLKATGAPEQVFKDFKALVNKSTKYISKLGVKADFYVGESVNDSDQRPGMIIPLRWKDNETIPYLTFWKHGLKAEKY